jgi:hypothetical protein
VYSKRREAEFRGVSFAIKIDTRSPVEEFTGNFDATDTLRRILINFGLIVAARQVLFSAAVSSHPNLADENTGMETTPSNRDGKVYVSRKTDDRQLEMRRSLQDRVLLLRCCREDNRKQHD